MPSFPGAVFSAGTRSAGQTIGSAHMNAVQDELNAITDGYLNATARLNSSASTLASLDVNGNSTLASSVTFGSIPYVMPSSGGSTGEALTCISTSGSTMTLEWRAAAAATPDAVKVFLQDVQQFAAGGSTSVSWLAQDFITNSSLHSTATTPDRLTPQSTGVYWAYVQTQVPAPSATMELYLEDSSGTFIAQGRSSGTAADVFLSAGTLKRFDVVGGYLRVIFASGGSTNRLSTGVGGSFASLVRL